MGIMMESPRRNIIIGVALVALFLGLGAWYQTRSAPMYDFPLAEGDTVESWSYQGAYTGNAELEARGATEIDRTNDLFGTEGVTDYELYVSLANQYDLLGDGEQVYNNLRKALAIDAEKTGLAWHNMGKLMEKLGALNTARIAYDRMVKAQQPFQYQEVRLAFLKTYFPEDTEAIAAAEAELSATLGEFILE